MTTIGDPPWRAEVERAEEFLSLIDADLRVLYVNHVQDEDYVGRSVFEFVEPRYHDRLREAVSDARAKGLPQHYGSEAAARDGGTAYYSNWVTCVSAGERAEVIVFVATDVTHRRRIEEALDVSERTLRAIVEKAPDHILILDRDRRIEFVNHVSYGLRVEDVLGARLDDFVVDAARPGMREAFDTVLRTGTTAFYDSMSDLPDGRHEFSVRLGPILRDGAVERIVMVSREVTAEREQQRAHARLTAQLYQAQKMEAIGQLTGGVAHDFNNLLMVLTGSLESAQMATSAAEAHRELEIALQTVNRAAALTQRLLAFSRRQPLRPEVADIGALLAGLDEFLRRSLGEAVALEIRCAGEVGRCEIDVVQLETVILNLAINARDAMPDGGKLAIEARATTIPPEDSEVDASPGEYVVIAVTDTGVGMEPAVIAQAFEPFFTTKEVGRGSGLGLSVAYGFVRQSGGAIQIRSRPGEGTTILVYLRRTEKGASATPSASPGSSGSGEQILVVEDDPQVRRVLERAIGSLGYRVAVAEDARRALERLAASPPIDLLVSDVILPGGMTGVELVRKARAASPGLAALLLSGYPRGAFEATEAVPENVELVAKPVRRQALAEAIQRALAPT